MKIGFLIDHQINNIAVVEDVLKVQKLNLNTAFIPTKIQVHVGNTEITGELQQISHNLSYCFHNLISISSEKIMEIDII